MHKFVTNNIESDNWVQFYFYDQLIWEDQIAWKYIRPFAERISETGLRVEVLSVDDEQMSNYSN